MSKMEIILMRLQISLIMVVCLSCFQINANAQNRKYLRIKERPAVRFDFDCTQPSLFPKSKLGSKVRKLREKDEIGGEFEDRAFAYDLNGDGIKEYFVPTGCGTTGNCNWAIFAINPTQYLGMVNGEDIYIHKRISKWSRLTVSFHMSVSESYLSTFNLQRGRYHEFGKQFLSSAYKNNFPTTLFISKCASK